MGAVVLQEQAHDEAAVPQVLNGKHGGAIRLSGAVECPFVRNIGPPACGLRDR